MPAVPITSREQYIKAIGVLDSVGGTWHGVGQDEWFLLVTPTLYEALIKERVISPANGQKEQKNAMKSPKSTKP